MSIVKTIIGSLEFSAGIMAAVSCIFDIPSQAAVFIGVTIYLHIIRKEMR